MSEDRPSSQKSWLEKISSLFSDDLNDRQDIKEILREAAQRHVLDGETLSILEGALQVSEMQVRDIMVPRAQMVSVNHDDTLQGLLPAVTESAHSRFPVLGEGQDEVLGILLAKDLIPLLLKEHSDDFKLSDVLRAATFVPESKRLNILLREFRATRNHMAIVIDEFGGISGLVTIEDVLEQIVGEIEDEHDLDDEDMLIKDLGDETHMVKALTPVEDFNKYFKTKLDTTTFDTIGGVVIHHFGRVPERDETIVIGSLTFKIVNGSGRRINLLQVTQSN